MKSYRGVKSIEAAILTPGPLGHNDYAAPDSGVPGFSPGPLGGHDNLFPLLSYQYNEKAGSQWRRNNHNHCTSWKTLKAAMALDFEAALQSCSWGMFQIMGFNYQNCGFRKLREFVVAMKRSEREHLMAFVRFCKTREGLLDAIRATDFKAMATLFNGEDYGTYDKAIEKAYLKHLRETCSSYH